MSMSVQQETAWPEVALRRQIIATELGPVMVRVQPGAGGGSPSAGTPDVYLHGAAGSWTTFEPLLADETAHDRVLIDLPGWGDSTAGAELKKFSIEAMGRAVAGLLESLGYRRWNLVGHSMGGFLALHMAAAWPERTAGVAAISATTFGVSLAGREPLRGLSGFPAYVGMLVAMRAMAALGPAGSALLRAISRSPLMGVLMSPFFVDPAAVAKRVTRGLGADARPASFAAAARAAAHYDFDRWRGIRCPVLATRGDSDVFTPPSDLSRLAEIVPHARLVTIPRCGHFPTIEQPAQVHRVLRDLRTPSPA